MRQVWITRRAGPEVLQVREVADPAPGKGRGAHSRGGDAG